VMHGAPYVNEKAARKQGRLWSQLGLPRGPSGSGAPVIDSLKNGQMIFAYYPTRTGSRVRPSSLHRQARRRTRLAPRAFGEVNFFFDSKRTSSVRAAGSGGNWRPTYKTSCFVSRPLPLSCFRFASYPHSPTSPLSESCFECEAATPTVG
jgi:hypothetical protein